MDVKRRILIELCVDRGVEKYKLLVQNERGSKGYLIPKNRICSWGFL